MSADACTDQFQDPRTGDRYYRTSDGKLRCVSGLTLRAWPFAGYPPYFGAVAPQAEEPEGRRTDPSEVPE